MNGKPEGIIWLGLLGKAFLLGESDPKSPGKVSSKKGAYIYPGFELAIVGHYEKNVLLSGQAAQVLKHRCEQGIR